MEELLRYFYNISAIYVNSWSVGWSVVNVSHSDVNNLF